MSRNAQRGAYFKGRTKKYLLARGWQVADMEIVRYVFTPKGRLPIKRDQWGADLIAMNANRVAFIQVKGGEQARGNGQFLDAQREFERVVFPPFVERWIVAWAPMATEPRIILCGTERQRERLRTRDDLEANLKAQERRADDEYFRSGTRYPGQ